MSSNKYSYGMVPPPASLSGKQAFQLQDTKQSADDKMKQYDDLTRSGTIGSTKKQFDPYGNVSDSYFEDDEEGDHQEPTSSGAGESIEHEEDEDEDPLDAFMAEINDQAQKAKEESEQKEQKAISGEILTGGQTGRDDIEQADMQESFFEFMEDYKAKHVDEDEEIHEYDEDGNIVWSWKRIVEPLPQIDHTTISYKPYKKELYSEHEDIAKLNGKQVFEFRMEHEISVFGNKVPNPVPSFAYFSFENKLMNQIRKSGFEKPTAIQSQAIPAILQGRDVIGLAETGSGKTLAYLWPAIVHILNQEELQDDDGPIALVVVPTRELAIQIYNQAILYCKPYNLNVVCAYGGGSKYEQKKALEEGAELVICTPGRIIDMVKIKATNFRRISFLVFDEVDRMYDLGFEAQVKSIADNIRPDRQCLMFSATMKPKIEKLAVHALYNPIKILCGDVGEVNADVEQQVIVLPDLNEKYNWLFNNIIRLVTMGKVLVFVSKKIDAEDVAQKLKNRNIDLVVLHGDMHQHERNEHITAFRNKKSVMVATDVAARGLDIPEIKNVINFDVAKDIETHVHRVGRTGRAGNIGYAYTLITEKDAEFCAHLVRNFQAVDQPISQEMMQVALKCPWFKAQQEQHGTAQGSMAAPTIGKQRAGLGFSQNRSLQELAESGIGNPPTGPSSSIPSARPFSGSRQSVAKPSISKTIERAKTAIGNSGVSGGTTTKADLMRSALKGSYQNSFKRATDEAAEYQRLPASDPRPEWKKALDERVARINQTLQSDSPVEKQKQQEQEQEKGNSSKKRSRWE